MLESGTNILGHAVVKNINDLILQKKKKDIRVVLKLCMVKKQSVL